jgi:hypothetical protein
LFDAAARPSSLHLDTPELLFEEFRKLLNTTLQLQFDEYRDSQRDENGNDTIKGFQEARRLLLTYYLTDQALVNQAAYFQYYAKENRIDCKQLGERLDEINRLSAVLNKGVPRWTEQELKDYYFNMMPKQWRLDFNRYGDQALSNPTYTLRQLACNMQTKMITEQIVINRREEINRRRIGNTNTGQRPQQYRRFNNGGRGGFSGGRYYNNSSSNNYYRPLSSNYYQGNNRGNQGSNGARSGNSYSGSGGTAPSTFNNPGRGYGGRGFGGRGIGGRGNYNQGRGFNSGRGRFGQDRRNNFNNGNYQQQGRQGDNFQVDDNDPQNDQNMMQEIDQYFNDRQEEYDENNEEQQEEYFEEPQEESHFLDNLWFGESY